MTPRKKAGTFFLCASVSVLIQIATVPSASAGMILGSTASTFAILGGGGVTGAAPTNTINGNLGACCTTDTITGYPANFALTGTEYAGSVAPESLAQGDLTTAITALNGLASGPTTTESDLTGLTLPPGVYVSGSALPMSLSGTLNLDGGSNANALWVFLVGSSLTINSTSTVNVYNTGAGAGVYWVMGATAYLDPNSVLEGNFLAYAGIPVGTNVTDPCGRLLTQTGSVTLAGSDTIGIGCSGVLAGSNGLGGGGTLSTVNGVPTITPSPGASVPEPGAFFFVAPCLAGLMILGKRSRSKLGRARA
jgi:hypothetical protein